ncbi:hypothetical protein LZ575_16780 [Antarcticibacterium sp. 1MA-6-2]|uniref:hypothetical protein n=1 Tax=Antarcticibacterium sp. 1MA-6-2 TaxID=2908210 RepID=UPI001F1DE2A1|nr:hypothetical protein [Antarcticibacterium sp. 1MA-6-2]UJH90457.1 hypothetical protein LZ575_16780 [Antarcticibacterium sp. 1MA-6-2]
MLHNLVFKPTSKSKRSGIRVRKSINFRPYQGKVIRNIIIQTLDPFGYSIYDTVSKPRNWAEAVGNKVHKKTNHAPIRDLLLFKENTPLDSLLLKESERLIRSRSHVRSVLVKPQFIHGKNRDSVDVTVRVLDSWSIIPEGSFSPDHTSVGLKERNFAGTGHEFRTRFTRKFDEGDNAYDLGYTIPNLKNTYIRTSLRYLRNIDESYYKGFNAERNFYSPFTRWAGGIYLDQHYRKDSLQNPLQEMELESFKYNTYDFWGGHSFRIFKGNTQDDRTTNLITSARMLNVDYREKPSAEFDSIGFFSGETFYLAGIGITSRQYVEDQYIFNYGIIEDVPVGTIYGITAGHQRKNGHGRLYLGGRVAYGDYFSWGFLSTNFEAGTYLGNKRTEQTTYSFQANYFTKLIDLNPTWKMRQFVKPQLIWGRNRLNSFGDRLTVNEHGNILGFYGPDYEDISNIGVQGFHSSLYGTRKFLLTLQTQFYAPWNLWGFRLNPYLNYTMAAIGDEQRQIANSEIYNSIGVGFIISNDYLVFDTFQLSFSFFPEMPGRGNNLFRTNTFNTNDFGFQDFEFGKPRPVLFK